MTDAIDFTPRTVLPAGTLVTLCTHFLQRIQNRGLALNTLRSYKTDLEQFVGFAKTRDVTLVQHINEALIEDWLDALIEGEGMQHRTAARKLETLKSFIRFCMHRRVLHFNPAEDIKIQFDVPRVVAPPEHLLLKVIESIPSQGVQNLRDRALLRLLYDGGLRVGGLLCLDVYDEHATPACCVNPHSGVVTYRTKGNRIRRTVVDHTTLQYLNDWLAVRPRYTRSSMRADHKNALCLSRLGTRMSREAIDYMVKKHGKAAGLPHLHAHLFRHRRLGDVYEQTGDLRLAADMGGHANIETFANIYGHTAGEVRRKRILTEAPLGRASEKRGAIA